MTTHDNNKGVYKIEQTYEGPNKARGAWVAMLTCDASGPEHFYGTEIDCRAYIDIKRIQWKAAGKELTQQSASNTKFASAS